MRCRLYLLFTPTIYTDHSHQAFASYDLFCQIGPDPDRNDTQGDAQ